MVLKPQKTKFQLKIVENIQTLSIWAKNPWRRYSISLIILLRLLLITLLMILLITLLIIPLIMLIILVLMIKT